MKTIKFGEFLTLSLLWHCLDEPDVLHNAEIINPLRPPYCKKET